MTRIYRF